MMINHNNKDKIQNNKEPLIVQENDTRNNTFYKPRKTFLGQNIVKMVL